MDILSVARAISYLRKRAGYTQKDLADRLGVSDKAVSKWERGLGLPEVSLLGKLSVLLDTDTDSLLSGDVIHHDNGWHGLMILKDNSYGIGPETVIFDKPLAYYLLSYFLLVGIRSIRLVCSEKCRAYFLEEFLGNHPLELDLTFSSSLGEVAADRSFMNCDNVMVLFGSSIIYGVDQTRFFQKAMVNRDKLTILALPRGNRKDNNILRFDSEKKIVPQDHNDMLKTQYNYCDIPILFCPSEMFRNTFLGTPAGTDITKITEDKDVYIEALDRGFVDIMADSWESVSEASNFVRIVQEHCGMVIYCIEEVAWRRGFIRSENVRLRGTEKRDTEYGRYLLALCDDFNI